MSTEQDATGMLVTVARVDKPLPADPDPDRGASSWTWDVDPEWPNGTIIQWDGGFWQLCDDGVNVVPITDDVYREHVEVCFTQICGCCQACVAEQQWYDSRAKRIEQLDTRFCGLVEQLRQAELELTATCELNIADDLDFDDEEDAKHHLEAAARELRAVQRIARLNVQRIAQFTRQEG